MVQSKAGGKAGGRAPSTRQNRSVPLPDLANLSLSDRRLVASIDRLEQSSPENQGAAIKLLLDETVANFNRFRQLSYKEALNSGYVQPALEVSAIVEGATKHMKIVCLKKTRPGVSQERSQLKKGVVVFVKKYYEPQDMKDQNRSKDNQFCIRGMLEEVSPEGFNVILEDGLEKALPKKGLLQLESSEMLSVYNRMLNAVNQLKRAELESTRSLFADLLLGKATIVARRSPVERSISMMDLNPSQREAVEYSLGSNLSIIKGPPGTGKTLVLYKIIMELLRRGESVLICCGSHTAVDNLIVRLQRHSNKYLIARIGHPHRIAAATRQHNLDFYGSDASPFLSKKHARVVAATLHAAYELEDFSPLTTVVIDEVCQALQAQCWIPLLSNKPGRRLIIAGDDKQLAPTITTSDSKAWEALDTTLFDAFYGYYGNEVLHLLDTQYRMSEEIMRFSSEFLYENKLKAAPNVVHQRLYNLPGVIKSPVTEPPLLWIDTSPLGSTEEVGSKGLIRNLSEAELVKDHCFRLQRQGVPLEDIGVVSPYLHQKNLLADMLPRRMDVNTVDGFQGQEKNVIILSLVRSNPMGTVGFLSDDRRLNVAITRAKYQLCVVANMKTLKNASDSLLQQWAHWCEDHATIVHPNRDGKTVDYSS